MKTTTCLSAFLICLIIVSCKTKTNKFTDEICSIKPDNWECKVIESNFDSLPILNGLEKIKAIVEFRSNDKSSTGPIFLFFYDISSKNDLEKIIQEKMKETNCVPLFFAENREFYVLTSSCYVNSSFFSSNENLKPAVSKLFTKYDESIVR